MKKPKIGSTRIWLGISGGWQSMDRFGIWPRSHCPSGPLPVWLGQVVDDHPFGTPDDFIVCSSKNFSHQLHRNAVHYPIPFCY